jgi:hypothetical protein
VVGKVLVDNSIGAAEIEVQAHGNDKSSEAIDSNYGEPVAAVLVSPFVTGVFAFLA